ncbi:signal peptidase complex subunit 2 [Brachionus plicatilis]|uniref:Signal peptidase complex subunit 2 n=1 Tax=Brachionus plicatilis TaxID=10195 RepID=A0A3M7SEN5_BRAPC|nr:signal peptidase complex subunit 2 [Brachionus plicatilis]
MSKLSFTSKIPEDLDETKIDKWDWNALKNALDDAGRKFLTNQKDCQETHSLMNGRLIISTIAVLFSLYAIGYDYLYPFPESKLVIIVCVASYFVTVGILTLYTSFIEKGCFAQVVQKLDNKTFYWKFLSKQKPHKENFYVLTIELQHGNKVIKKTVEKSVAKYFDENGVLVVKNYYSDLEKFCSQTFNDKRE